MRQNHRKWFGIEGRVRRYYRFLEDNVPQEFLQLLRRELAARQAPDRHPTIDRIRPGGPPRVRMPSMGEIGMPTAFI
jgi:hypothetical protein